MTLIEIITNLWEKLRKKRKIQLVLLLILMLFSGASEVIILLAIIPFLTAITNPQNLFENPFIKYIGVTYGITNPQDLMIPITVCFGIIALITSIVRLTNLWFNYRLSAAIGSDLSCEVYQRILYQPYKVHISRNSSEVIAAATSQIEATVGIIMLLMQMLTSIIVLIGIIGSLIVINTFVAIVAISVFFISYLLIAKGFKKRLQVNSKVILDQTRLKLKALQEGLGGIREVLLHGMQKFYISMYRTADYEKRIKEAQNQYIQIFPRFGIEGISMVLIAILTTVLIINQRNSSTNIIAVLGTLALGAQRLLPALQLTYGAWASVRGSSESVRDLINTLNQRRYNSNLDKLYFPINKLDEIEFRNVSFRYSQQTPYVLKNINLKIRKGDCIGLVGKTGSGKSTLIDILMGLLEPTSGDLLVNGININNSDNYELLAAWRLSISHVPQFIYLSDTTIKENIGFGLERHKIKMDKVVSSARNAQISNHIENLKEGYNTIVGERGVKLSGGQRQRIGIARSLYKEYSVLILDEATSALDSGTEEQVMQSIIDENKTIFMISHRLTTLRNCNKLFELESGTIKPYIQEI